MPLLHQALALKSFTAGHAATPASISSLRHSKSHIICTHQRCEYSGPLFWSLCRAENFSCSSKNCPAVRGSSRPAAATSQSATCPSLYSLLLLRELPAASCVMPLQHLAISSTHPERLQRRVAVHQSKEWDGESGCLYKV
eukprot:1377026-Amphidinium_carterae.1